MNVITHISIGRHSPDTHSTGKKNPERLVHCPLLLSNSKVLLLKRGQRNKRDCAVNLDNN